MDTVARIRREFFIRKRPIKEIVRELHVSRDTVWKVVRSGATALSYEREVQPLPKLGQWRADLDRLLLINAEKPSRERLTLMRIFEALRGLGYERGNLLFHPVQNGIIRVAQVNGRAHLARNDVMELGLTSRKPMVPRHRSAFRAYSPCLTASFSA